MGPTITSALRQQTSTEFSPVTALDAPAFSMAAVAALFVPTAVTVASGKCSFIAATSCLPIPPPCPSMTSTFMFVSTLNGL